MSKPMPLRLLAGLPAFLLATSLVTIGHAQENTGQASQGPSAVVRIDNFSFTPPEIAVEQGATLTWVNGDDIPHTVVAADKAFRSKVLDTDQSYTFTFTKPGTFAYFCSLHPHMTGKVIVK